MLEENCVEFGNYGRGRVGSGEPRNFVRGGGVQQIQFRTEVRENGDLGAVAPYSGILEAAVIWYKTFHFKVKFS